jgi:RecG-like helicase
MKFRTTQADDAYKEILAETGLVVQHAEEQARQLPIEARVHLIIEISKLRLSGHEKAILAAAQIDTLHAQLVVGAHAMLNQDR